MIQTEFCSYEVSKALYELGYDYASLGSYTDPKTFNLTEGGLMYRIISFPPDNPQFCLAPLWQQAARFLYDKSSKEIILIVNGKDDYEDLCKKFTQAIEDFGNL